MRVSAVRTPLSSQCKEFPARLAPSKAFKLPVDAVDSGREGMKKIADRVAEARFQIGPDADLMIDCLARFDVPYTLELAERLGPYRVRWIEEHCTPTIQRDTRRFARRCGVR
jgi:L-alanine-DL-glutamate epimerase-like enolase superfamily enzyme